MERLINLDTLKTLDDLRGALADCWGGIAILTTNEALTQAGITEEQAEENADYYEAGGDPDVWLDIATSPKHYFFNKDRIAEAKKVYFG
jgi:hypothetical protein